MDPEPDSAVLMVSGPRVPDDETARSLAELRRRNMAFAVKAATPHDETTSTLRRRRLAGLLFFIALMASLLLAMVAPAVNLVIVLIAGIPPRELADPAAGVQGIYERWGGLVPVSVPWWSLTIPIVMLIGVLVLIRDYRMWALEQRRGIVLATHPVGVLLCAALLAIAAAFVSALYREPSEPLGAHWIPIIACIVLGAAASFTLWWGRRERRIDRYLTEGKR